MAHNTHAGSWTDGPKDRIYLPFFAGFQVIWGYMSPTATAISMTSDLC
jgi:hypothetical protein